MLLFEIASNAALAVFAFTVYMKGDGDIGLCLVWLLLKADVLLSFFTQDVRCICAQYSFECVIVLMSNHLFCACIIPQDVAITGRHICTLAITAGDKYGMVMTPDARYMAVSYFKEH